MPGRLFHSDYRAGFRFGAVTLCPGMTPADKAGQRFGLSSPMQQL